ncbi:O-antigen ligase family protein [Actinomadura flavalba]|uniref:O-antigen ligase family protein n=1 Tax=Actinomadura flavalba TaxID=1120938 RepID=UPI000364953F|nr:O-antigen ligase family protein [Actinomadura flavalba]
MTSVAPRISLPPPRPAPDEPSAPRPAPPLRRLWAAIVRRPSWLVAATVVSVAVPAGRPGGGISVTAADVASAVMVLFVTFVAVSRRRALPARALPAFAPLVVALGVTTLASQDVEASLPGFVRTAQIFVLVPLAVVLAVQDRRDVGIIGGAVLATALGEGVFGLWQALTLNGASYGGRDVRAVGTFGSLDIMALATLSSFGIVLAVAFTTVVRGRFRLVLLLAVVVQLAALGAALSRGSFLALVIAVTVMLALYDRLVLLRVAVCVAALAIIVMGGFGLGSETVGARLTSIADSVGTPDQSVSDRYSLWGTATAIWREHPVTGVGVKNFSQYRDTYAPLQLSSGSETADARNGYVRQPLLSPHNQYLLILSEQGLLGLAAFVTLLLALVRGLWRHRSRDDAAWPLAVGFLCWLLVNFLYADMGGPTSVLTSILLGLAATRALSPPGRGPTAPGAPR